jgi:triacylglycerol lipase
VPTIIHDVGERPLVLHSEVREPLATVGFLRRSLALAELAMIAYNDEDEARRAASAIGFPDVQLFDQDGSQDFWFRNEHDCVVACRGTEPTEWNDIQADANAALAVVGTLGKVHSGFNREVDDLWPLLKEALRPNKQPVWFCGHSLGAAMATICACRCQQSSIASKPAELHTFGSPRVGCRRYVRHTQLLHYRWVHNNDIVTRVPPAWMGYRHGGHEIYLDRNGRIRKLTGVFRSRDRWRGLLRGLWKWQLDLLVDHSIQLYAEHIARAVERESRAMEKGGGAVRKEDIVIRERDASESLPPAPHGEHFPAAAPLRSNAGE